MKGKKHDHFGGPDQEKKLPDHNINIHDDVVEDDDHNGINIILDDLSGTNSDTRVFNDTNEAPQNDDDDDDNPDYLSDEDGTDDPDATPKIELSAKQIEIRSQWRSIRSR